MWPAGYLEEAEAGLIDAVFSLNAGYGGDDSDLRAVVTRRLMTFSSRPPQGSAVKTAAQKSPQ